MSEMVTEGEAERERRVHRSTMENYIRLTTTVQLSNWVGLGYVSGLWFGLVR